MLSLKEMQSFRKVNHKVHGAGEKMTIFFNLGVKTVIENDCNHYNHHFLWQEDVHFYISSKYTGKLGGGETCESLQ